MKSIVTAAILAVGLAVGAAMANAQTVVDQSSSVIEHHTSHYDPQYRSLRCVPVSKAASPSAGRLTWRVRGYPLHR